METCKYVLETAINAFTKNASKHRIGRRHSHTNGNTYPNTNLIADTEACTHEHLHVEKDTDAQREAVVNGNTVGDKDTDTDTNPGEGIHATGQRHAQK